MFIKSVSALLTLKSTAVYFQDSISAIESGKITSVYQFRLYIIAKVTYGDLLALDWFQKPGSENSVENEQMAQKVYQTYLDALQSAVQLGFNYGEVMEKRIEDDAYSTIEAPLKNLFSTTYLPLLAHIKLRLGHCLCRKSVYYDSARWVAKMKLSYSHFLFVQIWIFHYRTKKSTDMKNLSWDFFELW